MAVILALGLLTGALAIGVGVLAGAGVLRLGRRGQHASLYEWAAIAAGAAVAGGLMALVLFWPWE